MRRSALMLLLLVGSLVGSESSRATSVVDAAKKPPPPPPPPPPLSIVSASRTTNIQVSDPAGPVQFYSDSSSGVGPWTSDLYQPSPTGIWPGVRAYQDSLISDSLITGVLFRATGDVSMSTTGDFADSDFRVVFTLATGVDYSFFVDNLDNSPAYSWNPRGSVTLDLLDPVSNAVVQRLYGVALDRFPNGQGAPDFSAQGALAPGTYALEYRISVTGSHNAAGPGLSGFQFAIVPEPGTALLVFTGLLGLGARRPT